MTKYIELIARLEALTGPDREVDARINCALLAPVKAYVEQSPFNGEWCIYDGEYGGRPRLFQFPRDLQNIRLASITGSLDAAVALCERVLPGWRYIICPIFAEVKHPEKMMLDRYGHGANPAIALLIATLKALDAKENEE